MCCFIKEYFMKYFSSFIWLKNYLSTKKIKIKYFFYCFYSFILRLILRLTLSVEVIDSKNLFDFDLCTSHFGSINARAELQKHVGIHFITLVYMNSNYIELIWISSIFILTIFNIYLGSLSSEWDELKQQNYSPPSRRTNASLCNLIHEEPKMWDKTHWYMFLMKYRYGRSAFYFIFLAYIWMRLGLCCGCKRQHWGTQVRLKSEEAFLFSQLIGVTSSCFFFWKNLNDPAISCVC